MRKIDISSKSIKVLYKGKIWKTTGFGHSDNNKHYFYEISRKEKMKKIFSVVRGDRVKVVVL